MKIVKIGDENEGYHTVFEVEGTSFCMINYGNNTANKQTMYEGGQKANSIVEAKVETKIPTKKAIKAIKAFALGDRGLRMNIGIY